MRYLKPLLPVAVVLICAGAARAEEVTVMIDHAARLNVRGAANVVIGNAAVADVTVVDSRTVYVIGRAYGSTNVIVSDRDGRTLFSGDVTVGAPASTVAVYRGGGVQNRTEMACAPGCSEAAHPNQGAPGGGSQTNPFLALLQANSAPPRSGSR